MNNRCRGLVWLLALGALAVVAGRELPDGAEKIADESRALSEDDLSNIVSDFGQEIQEVLRSGIEEITNDHLEGADGNQQLDTQQLAKLKEANEALSEDAAKVIGLAAKKNEGELTQASWGSVKAGAASFATQVNQRLQSAGNFIGHQMDSLGAIAPKVKSKMRALPIKVLKIMRWPTFLNFKMKFNKAYKSVREELYRQMLYLRSQAVVAVQNLRFLLRKSTYLKKATQFADTTTDEYARDYNNEHAETPTAADIEAEGLGAADRERLAELARQGSNIFHEHIGDEPESKNEVRKKRSLSELEEEEDEDEDEENTMNIDGNMAIDDVNEAAELDALAAQMDGADIDNIENVVDDAISDKDFKPVDYRKTGCLIEPENQYKCGNCFAIAVSTASSFYRCMMDDKVDGKTSEPVTYSSRFISDCGVYLYPEGTTDPIHIHGCSGGRLGDAIKFASRAGNNGFFFYEARRNERVYESDSCALDRPPTIDNWGRFKPPTHFQKSTFTFLQLDEVGLHLSTIGPVFVNVRTWEDFNVQGPGIYDGFKESRRPTIHSMLVVGQDRDHKGRKYYIVWNSHGVAWGENGYLRIYADSLDYFAAYYVGLIPNGL